MRSGKGKNSEERRNQCDIDEIDSATCTELAVNGIDGKRLEYIF